LKVESILDCGFWIEFKSKIQNSSRESFMSLRYPILLIAAMLAAASGAGAQLALPAPDPANKDARQGVYVRDSAVAAEKLALAQRMERLKEWDKSADVYQEIVEKYADRVVPIGGEGNEKRYSSVTLAVQDLLGKWPEEGLAAYRARYETPAATMLEAAGTEDISALNRVVQRYFPTDAAKAAGLRLTEMYIENGEFAAAAWLGERLLQHHPALAADRPKLLFRTALAQHLAGNDAAAKPKLDELKSQHATAVGMVRGQEVVLAGELEKLLAQPAAVAHGASGDSWPMLGGDVSRGRVPNAAGRPGAKLVDIPFIRSRQRPAAVIHPEMRGQLEMLEKQRRDFGLSLAIMPVVDRDELFFQDNTRVYAKGLDGGLTLPGWSTTYGEDAKVRFAPASMPLPSNAQLTVTITDHSVLAILGQYDQAAMINEAGMPVIPEVNTQLVCLDRATGARKWSISPSQFPESMGNLKELDLGGSPLVIGENVYVAARGGKPMQFEDAYVLCFNLADGKLRWACYIASGNAPDQNYTGNPMPSTGISHLAYAGGRLYSVTNIGAVAAIDAYAGTIVWLNLYPRPTVNQLAPQLPQNGMAGARKPWALNPAIVKDGRVFCLPSDSQHLLIYDAGEGNEIKRIAISQYDNADSLLGVVADKLIVSGRNKVFCINWPAYEPRKPINDTLHWAGTASVSGTTKENQDTVRGRGFVTADSVFIPTTVALRRFSMKNGAIAENYPRDGGWAAGEGPGNVVVTQDQVILAGVDGISIYSDLAMARAKLDRAVAEAPQNPLPRLKYAETLFAAGQLTAAVEKLDEAIQLLGGLNSMRPGADRDGAFSRALVFAERAADPKIGASNPDLAGGLYDRAGAAANSPAQHVSYRFSRAHFARAQRDFATEVRLFQEVLATPQYRQVIVPTEDGTGTTPAATAAEGLIAQRVKDAPATYKPFEEAAARDLAAAKQKADPNLMLAVAQTYPNAQTAPEALLAAADAYEAGGKYRLATQVLNQAYRKYTDQNLKTRIVESQARNYLRLPNGVGIAISRLREGSKLPGGMALKRSLTLPDGGTIENVSFGAAAEMLQHYSARIAAASLPQLNIQSFTRQTPKPFLPENPDTLIGDVDLLVLPPSQLRDLARHDRVITWSAQNGISLFAIGSNKPLANASTITQKPRGAVWLGQELLVWTNEKVLLLREGGAIVWETPVKSLPQVDVLEGGDQIVRGDPAGGLPRGMLVGQGMIVVDNQVINLGRGRVLIRNGQRGAAVLRPVRAAAEAPEIIEHVLPVGDRVVVGTSSGRIASLELTNGQLAWQTRLGTVHLDQLLANDDFLAARFADDTGAQLVALDTFSGQVVTRLGFTRNSGQSIMNAALAPDGTLVYTLPDRVCGRDLYEPGKPLKFGDSPTTTEGTRLFEGANGPDQLVIAEGRIFAAADQGQFIRVLSLDNGVENPNPRGTGANNWQVWMRVVGPRLYVFNPLTVTSYSLDRDESWSGYLDSLRTPNVRDAFIGKRHVVLLDQPTVPGAEPKPSAAHFRLLCYGRYEVSPGHESGKLEQTADVTNPVGIDQWQPVEGGFYYRSLDRKAHFLKGAAPPGH
jgi:outer membrane protein assembly factor BamB